MFKQPSEEWCLLEIFKRLNNGQWYSFNQVIICTYTLLRMRDFTASDSIDSFGLAWGPDTIDKERKRAQWRESRRLGRRPAPLWRGFHPPPHVDAFYFEYSCMWPPITAPEYDLSFYKWKATKYFDKWKTTSVFLQIEDDLNIFVYQR